MENEHKHDHSHHSNKKVLTISFILIFLYMIVEIIGGLVTGSLALLSDAGHMLSDAASLGLSLFAFKFGEKAATKHKTFGYKRFEILAAFINGVTLILISFYIYWEAFHRFTNPPEVASTGMLIIASAGFLVNLIVAKILHSGDTNHNLNLRSAFLHVLGDLLGSVGAIIAALLIIFLGWNIADPIASMIVATLVIVSGWRVTRDSVHVLMEGKPEGVRLTHVKDDILQIKDVKSIHDLHIWSITSDFPSLTCHIVVDNECNRDEILLHAKNLLTSKYGIYHSTVQIEGEHSQLVQKEGCHDCY